MSERALAGICPALEAMSDADLRLVRSAKDRITSTNCWWLLYNTAPILSEIARDILRSRSRARRRAAALAKREERGAE